MSTSELSEISSQSLEYAYSQAILEMPLDDLSNISPPGVKSASLKPSGYFFPSPGEGKHEGLLCDEGLDTPSMYLQMESHSGLKVDATESIKSRLCVKHETGESHFSTEHTSTSQQTGKAIIKLKQVITWSHLVPQYVGILIVLIFDLFYKLYHLLTCNIIEEVPEELANSGPDFHGVSNFSECLPSLNKVSEDLASKATELIERDCTSQN